MKHLSWGFLLLGLSLAQAPSISISGLPAFEELSGVIVGERLEGSTKILEVDKNEIRINPWPAFAPKRLSGMSFKSVGSMHPDGPSYKLEFSKPDQTPDFIMGISWMQRREAIAGYSFTLPPDAKLALFTSKTQTLSLLPNQPVVLYLGGQSWCVRLLGIRFPQADTPGVANEQSQPRFDWMAARVTRQLARECSVSP